MPDSAAVRFSAPSLPFSRACRERSCFVRGREREHRARAREASLPWNFSLSKALLMPIYISAAEQWDCSFFFHREEAIEN